MAKSGKRTLSLVMVVLIVLSMFSGMTMYAAADSETAYTGQTAAGSYTIGTAAQLAKLSEMVKAGNEYEGSTFKLTADIDLSKDSSYSGLSWTGGSVWTPIGQFNGLEGSIYGTHYFDFKGTFDGNAHYVKNVSISGVAATTVFGEKGEGNALFGTNRGTIKNLGVTANIATARRGAAIAGFNYGTIQNCYANATITANGKGSTRGSGIIAGTNFGTISYCLSAGSVSNLGNAGGIAGYNTGTIDHCYSLADASSSEYGKKGAGVITGLNQKDGDYTPSISKCYYPDGKNANGQSSESGTISELASFDSNLKVGETALKDKLNEDQAGTFIEPAKGTKKYPVLAWQTGFSWSSYDISVKQVDGGTLTVKKESASGDAVEDGESLPEGSTLYLSATAPETGYYLAGFTLECNGSKEVIARGDGDVTEAANTTKAVPAGNFTVSANYVKTDTDIVFTVYTQTGTDGLKTKVKTYTWDELNALKKTYTEQYSGNGMNAAGYGYYKNNKWTFYAVTEYVTVSDILNDAFDNDTSGLADKQIVFDSASSKVAKPTYESLSSDKNFYDGTVYNAQPSATPADGYVAVDSTGSINVPAAIAISYAKGTLTSSNTNAGDLVNSLASQAQNRASLLSVWGTDAADLTSNNGASVAGNRLWSGVSELVVRTATSPISSEDVTAATLKDTDDSTPYNSYDVSYSSTDKKYKVTASGLRCYTNSADESRDNAYWAGISIKVPAGTSISNIKLGTNNQSLRDASDYLVQRSSKKKNGDIVYTDLEFAKITDATAEASGNIDLYWSAAECDLTSVQVSFDGGTKINEFALDQSGITFDAGLAFKVDDTITTTGYNLSDLKTYGKTVTIKKAGTPVTVTGITIRDFFDKVVVSGDKTQAGFSSVGFVAADGFKKSINSTDYSWDDVMIIWSGDNASEAKLEFAVNSEVSNTKGLWGTNIKTVTATAAAFNFADTVYLTDEQLKTYPTTHEAWTMNTKSGSKTNEVIGITVKDIIQHYAPLVEPATIVFKDDTGSSNAFYDDEINDWSDVMVIWKMDDNTLSGYKSAKDNASGKYWWSNINYAQVSKSVVKVNGINFTQERLAAKQDLTDASWTKGNSSVSVSGITIANLIANFNSRGLMATDPANVVFTAGTFVTPGYTTGSTGDDVWKDAALIWDDSENKSSESKLMSGVNGQSGKYWATSLETVTFNTTREFTITTSPSNATVEVTDSSGNAVTKNDAGKYIVITGDTYTYRVSASGYTPKEATFIPGLNSLSLNVTLSQSQSQSQPAGGSGGANPTTPVEEKQDAILSIYTKEGRNGTPVLAAQYTETELNGLSTRYNSGYVYQYGSESTGWNAVVATKMVKLESLLSDAGVSFGSGDSLRQDAPDGFNTTFTYTDMSKMRYFYNPASSYSRSEVPAGIALWWESGTISEESSTTSKIATAANQLGFTGSLRFVIGASEEQFDASKTSGANQQSIPGYRLASNLSEITVIHNAEITETTGRVTGGGSNGGGDQKQEETQKPATEIIEPETPLAEVPLSSTGYSDVPAGSWYEAAVQSMKDKGVMKGISDTEFGPDLNVTRGQFVTMLYRMENSPASGSCKFTDVKPGSYYESAIAWASENGIVTGYNETSFGPDDSITREQLAVIIYNYIKFKGNPGFTGSWYFLLEQSDAASVAEWADEAMHWCCMNKIINGYEDNTLRPQNNATRAQVAVMTDNLLSCI